jgi:hypothetical protein
VKFASSSEARFIMATSLGHTHLGKAALIGASIAVSLLGSACAEPTDQYSALAANESPTESAAVKSETSLAQGDGASNDASAADSVCGNFAETISMGGTWEPSYDTPEGKQAGFEDQPSLGDTNTDLGIACSIQGENYRYLHAGANRVIDPVRWAETVTYRTTGSDCHSISVDTRFTVGWMCPPNARSSDTSGVAERAGWVYMVSAYDWPVPPNDAELSTALSSWSDAIGDPTTYTLTHPESLPPMTTSPLG